jgi:hypothetical protein
VQDAIDEREPECDQAVDPSKGQAVKDLLQEKLQNRVSIMGVIVF